MRTEPERNKLLFLLPQRVKKRLFPKLREIELSPGREIATVVHNTEFVYFPTDCIICTVGVTLDGHTSGLSVVGSEGMVGISALLSKENTLNEAIVVSPGTVYRLAVTDLKYEFDCDGSVRLLMLRYTQTLMTQIAQNVACNRFHTVTQQLCRWLLMSLDRLPESQVDMTHELIANMLGVRRESVTQAAGMLQGLGIIGYRHGHITVLDRPRMESLCCECYGMVKQETDRLLMLTEVSPLPE